MYGTAAAAAHRSLYTTTGRIARAPSARLLTQPLCAGGPGTLSRLLPPRMSKHIPAFQPRSRRRLTAPSPPASGEVTAALVTRITAADDARYCTQYKLEAWSSARGYSTGRGRRDGTGRAAPARDSRMPRRSSPHRRRQPMVIFGSGKVVADDVIA